MKIDASSVGQPVRSPQQTSESDKVRGNSTESIGHLTKAALAGLNGTDTPPNMIGKLASGFAHGLSLEGILALQQGTSGTSETTETVEGDGDADGAPATGDPATTQMTGEAGSEAEAISDTTPESFNTQGADADLLLQLFETGEGDPNETGSESPA